MSIRLIWCCLPLLFSTGALAQAQSSQAQSLDVGFSLPSGRLQCDLDTDAMSIRCDVQGATFRVPRPADCPLDWGDAVQLGSTGRALFVCHGDTILDSRRPVLAYGGIWRRSGLTCRSAPTGVRCVNTSGHGFELARARYRLF